MKNVLLVCIALFIIPAIVKAQDEKKTLYGKDFTVTNVVDANKLPSLLDTKTEVDNVVAKGKITSVCKARGCWMKVDLSNGQELMVKFGDDDFFLPKDCDGKTVYFTGKLFRKLSSVKELRHLAEDAGKTKEEIEKITAPQEEMRFNATGVMLVG